MFNLGKIHLSPAITLRCPDGLSTWQKQLVKARSEKGHQDPLGSSHAVLRRKQDQVDFESCHDSNHNQVVVPTGETKSLLWFTSHIHIN